MAEDADAGAGTLQNGVDNDPQVSLIAQYVKDLSFENPNAPAVYQWQGQPRIDVQFNIGAQNGLGRAQFERSRERSRDGRRVRLDGRISASLDAARHERW